MQENNQYDDSDELSEFEITQKKEAIANVLLDIGYAGSFDRAITKTKRYLFGQKELAKVMYENMDTFRQESELFWDFYSVMLDKGFSKAQSYDLLWNMLILPNGFVQEFEVE